MAKVFIGVGHGGKDPGAVASGLRESDINLVVALSMRAELVRHGVTVGISRATDENDPLAEEIRECNAFAPDVAVECHTNAGGGDGFEAYQQQIGPHAKASLALAKAIEKQVVALGQNSRGIKGERSPQGYIFGWLSGCKCPAVLCECAFLDNKTDVQIVDTIEEQQAFGVAYAKGVLDYLGIVWKPQGNAAALTPIMGKAAVTVAQMGAYLRARNPSAPDYSAIFLEEGAKEGVRGDIAFAQSCLETGHWRFGGDVKPDQNNFCGLGATGGGEPGLSFATPEQGIRVQIQHLKAYASTEDLIGVCIDPRFKYAKRGSAANMEWLGIPDNPGGKFGWAAAKGYGEKILAILAEIRKVVPGEVERDIQAVLMENEALRGQLADMRRDVAALAEKYRVAAAP